jgi:hypothetical protein
MATGKQGRHNYSFHEGYSGDDTKDNQTGGSDSANQNDKCLYRFGWEA